MHSQSIKLTPEQQKALEIMESGVNVFLTGEAGTGKSTVLSEFRKRNDAPTVYVAPTGIAAINIGGQTIHSCFRIKPGVMSDVGPIESRRTFELLKATRIIVIDEISMVRSDLLKAIDVRMRQVAAGKDLGKPFGGRQVIVVGDFCQLPPVVSHSNEYSYLAMRYGGVFAFQSDLWDAAEFVTVHLSEIHRQNDERFISILNAVRKGDTSVVDELNKLVSIDSTDRSITLTPYRATADRINTARLTELNTPAVKYHGTITGKFTKDLPVDLELELKVGARVMIAANKYSKDGSRIYCNGELGEVLSLTTDSVLIRRDDGSKVYVSSFEWQAYEYDYSGSKVEAVPVGSYTQIPVRLAWAVTIHKSQGCTFEDVILDLGRGCFADGQLYTALSRVRSISGLSLTREVNTTDIRIDRAVKNFYKY